MQEVYGTSVIIPKEQLIKKQWKDENMHEACT
jgi:hypothetical protein